jgi:hypothetical protein
MSNEADGMLYLLKAEPTLLPEAPADTTVAQMERRFIKERQREGIERTKADGIYQGGKRRLNRAMAT